MFYFSNKTEYGLFMMRFLAEAKSRVSLRSMSEESGLPHRFLAKIIRDLVDAGLVEAKEGKGGGYTLAKKSSQISLLDIINALDEPISFSRCLLGEECPNNLKSCKIKPIWARLKKNIDSEIRKIKLSDVV